MPAEVDCVVAGAGPAGSTIARILTLKGKSVLLVDPAIGAVDRLEVLAPANLDTVSALDLLGVLDDCIVSRPCLGIRKRWGSSTTIHEDFLLHPHGRGYVIDRRPFDCHLGKLAAAAGAEVFEGRVIEIGGDAPWPIARLSRQGLISEVTARIVIDATGRPANLARRAGARRIFSERLIAIQLETGVDQPATNEPTWLDVQSEGERSWTYRLSGPRGRGEAWRVSSGKLEKPARDRLTVDASAGLLSVAAGANWIAIGDAAACFDPIASQGLANALSTAMVASGIVLSTEGLTAETAEIYTTVVRETFAYSEAGRRSSYESLKPGTPATRFANDSGSKRHRSGLPG